MDNVPEISLEKQESSRQKKSDQQNLYLRVDLDGYFCRHKKEVSFFCVKIQCKQKYGREKNIDTKQTK